MDLWNALTTFAKVAESGSFARAAARLGRSTSAVSRQVAELEAHLNVRLLNRTTRRLSLTEPGQAFYERCVQLVADLEDAEGAVRSAAAVPRGTLRVTCSITFGARYLAPAIAQFAERHPQLAFDLDLSERAVDLVEEGFDLALRIGAIGSQGFVSRRLGTTQLVCCASPTYLERRPAPRTPADLASHDCLQYTQVATAGTWVFDAADGQRHEVPVTTRYRANNGGMLVALAVAGCGIVLEPDFIVAPEVRAGGLVRLLDDYAPARSSIAAVYPSRRHVPAKVRAFVDFLAERFTREQPWRIEP